MNHWLMKSEPDAFSISDLENRPHQTDKWDGVRNYQVRNWLRDTIKIGDRAFFYHSSCEIPGIAGIIEIVKAGYPDPTAFDPSNIHFDLKSSMDKPRWFCVDVKLIKKFDKLITLQELKTIPELSGMRLLEKGSRLSITPVSEKEWAIIAALPNIASIS